LGLSTGIERCKKWDVQKMRRDRDRGVLGREKGVWDVQKMRRDRDRGVLGREKGVLSNEDDK
jgi:hypothetical protein